MTCLITGATGDIGFRVVNQLLQRGERPRVFVRNMEKAEQQFGHLVDIFRGSFDDPSSLARALNGADTVFLVTVGPDIPRHDAIAADCAIAAKVRHIVKLSTVDTLPDLIIGSWHEKGEAAIRASGIPFTFLQPSGFMSNLLAWSHSIKHEGIVRSSTADGRRPFIHCDDIAAVAVAGLTSRDYDGASLPLTGPEALTFAEITARISAAIRKPLIYEPISDDEARHHYASATGADQIETEAHVALWRAIRENRLATVTDTVERALGRKPLGFDLWLAQNLHAFA